MAITVEIKLCLSNFSRGIENQKGYQGINTELSLVQLIYFQPYLDWAFCQPKKTDPPPNLAISSQMTMKLGKDIP